MISGSTTDGVRARENTVSSTRQSASNLTVVGLRFRPSGRVNG
jgi:hypothetical protein